MTIGSIDRRLRKVEDRRGCLSDVMRLTDEQLRNRIDAHYRDLRAEHGSLTAVVRHLRETGDEVDAALAILIEKDIGRPDAQRH